MLETDTINDLVVRSEERETLWKVLREWADQEQSYGAQDLPEIDIDPATWHLYWD